MKWINESWESRRQLQPPRTFLSVWWWELFQRLRAAAPVLLYLFWGQCVGEELRRRQQNGEGVFQQEQVYLQGNDNILPRTSVCWIHQSRSDSSDNIPRSELCGQYSLYISLLFFFFLGCGKSSELMSLKVQPHHIRSKPNADWVSKRWLLLAQDSAVVPWTVNQRSDQCI